MFISIGVRDMNMQEIWLPEDPAHQRYGFGPMSVGDVITIDLEAHNETKEKIQRHISAHGQYHGKKYKTRSVDGLMYVKRIA